MADHQVRAAGRPGGARSSGEPRGVVRGATDVAPRRIRPRRTPLGRLPSDAVIAVAPDLADGADTVGVRPSRWLRVALFGLDATAVVLGWVVTLALAGVSLRAGSGALLEVAAVIGVTLVAIGWQGLYLSRVCSVRAVETVRLGRAAALGAVVALIVSPRIGHGIDAEAAVVAGTATFLLLVGLRSLYNAWLHRVRLTGRFCRPVVVVGTGAEGFELYHLLDVHPELGFRVEGVVGSESELRQWDVPVPWLGEVDRATAVIAASGANGALVAANDLSSDDLNRVTRALLRQGIHVHLSSGLRGIDYRRLRSLPLAHEPLFYLEPLALSRWQLLAKRALDLTVALLLVALFAPVMLVAAIAIKLQDGGPLLFRQRRVGRDGEDFTVLKLRTMVPDAEDLLAEVQGENERDGGPLFKLEQDPRRTRVGRILERTSIDELPQLFNVIRGEMSLVGPRPALRSEVEQFDGELLARQRVMPGITGLWQVEGRDNPAFDVYRRLDLFYIENWSVGLDLAIMLGTARSILFRLIWRSPRATAPLPGPRAIEADLAL
jgi:exopolysaccharide biosynthesis polyprenyl glycosylphosphotransferase